MSRQQGVNHAQIQERRVVGVEDMVLLSQVENKAIVQNLQARFSAQQIYTYIGPVLIACNPFQWLKLYEPHHIKQHQNAHRADLEPHIYAIAESAFRTMLAEEEKQCVIISGESGAGKTEAAKQIMNYVAAISGSGGNDRAVQEVKQIVLDSNPALEAFGNAMTLRNNNSSRFGKYFELRFDLAGGGTPRGGYVTNYLLEKSRVVKPGPGERAFHIFYQLLRGAPRELRDNLGLSSNPEHFNVLRMSGVSEINNEGGRTDDAKEFKETLSSLQTIGVFPEDQHDLFLVVALVLHLSNIDFYPVNIDGADGSQVSDENAVHTAAALMQVDAGSLAYSLTYRTLTTMAPGGKVETYQVPMNPTQARAARDALAKDLYSRLFDRIVGLVNDALLNCGNNTRVSMRRSVRNIGDDDGLSIGVLDIYGFEIFEENHFEQFCINYVNEKLQQIFIELTLKGEQEDYANEGIAWTPIPFFDNKVVCDLIESKKPPGVFAILDDTCKTAHSLGSADDKFLDKLNSFQGSHPHYSKFRAGFVVQHYAGKVSYHVDGFIEANKDVLGQDLQLLCQSSTHNYVRGLYPEEVDLDQRRQPTTAGYKIKRQCGDLVYALLDCNPHYVRCIKSNDRKQAGLFDADRVLHQVRYLGLLENVKVRRAGFALRIEFFRFIHRFKVLAAGRLDPRVLATGSDYDIAFAILDAAAYSVTALQQPGEAQLGRTKVFIKSPETFAALQEMRKQMVSEQVVKIQKLWRRFANRKELVDLRQEMADLWEEQGKESTPTDLLRPYHSFYIKDPALTQAISQLLEVYQLNEVRQEKIEYSEMLQRVNGRGQLEPVVFVLTDQAMYLARWEPVPFQAPKGASKQQVQQLMMQYQSQPKQFNLTLIRRSDLRAVEGVALSKEADDLVLVQMAPQEMVRPDKSQWVDKKKVKRCMDTQQPFSFFGKSKHQCHYTGNIYIKDVMTKIALPDRGFYQPVEVHYRVPGTVSLEMREDFVLQSEKKAEIVAALRNLVTLAKGGAKGLANNNDFSSQMQAPRGVGGSGKPMCRALYDYSGEQDDELSFREGDKIEVLDSSHADWWMGSLNGRQGVFPANYTEMLAAQPAHKPRRANPKRYLVPVTFSNQWLVRPATARNLSNAPGGSVEFQRHDGVRETQFQFQPGRLIAYVPVGVAGRKLRAIQQSQAERRARKEAERQQLMEQRRINAAQREQQRREDREKRLANKKEKRRAEKDKRDKEQSALNFGAKNALKGGASFKDRIANSGTQGRLNGSAAATPAWVRDRANGSSASSRGNGSQAQQSKQPSWVTQRNGGASGAASVKKWDRRSFQRPAMAKPAAAAAPKVTWEAYTDDNTGDVYYYNPTSGESLWERPTGNVKIEDNTNM